MAGLTLAYLTLSVLADEGADRVIGPLVAGLAVLFFLEFAVRSQDAQSRLEYLRAHWIDLVTVALSISIGGQGIDGEDLVDGGEQGADPQPAVGLDPDCH